MELRLISAGRNSPRDLPPIMCEQTAHFFQHYRDLGKGKWVSIVRWLDAPKAEKFVMVAIERGKERGKDKPGGALNSYAARPCVTAAIRADRPASRSVTRASEAISVRLRPRSLAQ